MRENSQVLITAFFLKGRDYESDRTEWERKGKERGNVEIT